jgi:uncharacterized membrane-anchored protein YhcB (DUF1043 family)
MIPESKDLHDGYTSAITILVGIIIGFIMINVI